MRLVIWDAIAPIIDVTVMIVSDVMDVMEVTQNDRHELQDGDDREQADREQTTIHINDQVHKPKIRNLLKAMINSLSVMGMHFNIRRGRCSKCPKLRRSHGCVVYSTLILLFLSIFTVRHIRHSYGSTLMEWIKRIVWDMHALSHFVIFYVMSLKSCLSRFCNKWQAYRDTYNIPAGSISRKINICVSFLWMFTSLNVICDAYMTYTYFQSLDIPEEKGGTSHLVLLMIFTILIDAYTVFAWTVSSALVLLVCILLADEFEIINKEMKQLLRDNREQFYKSIGDLRYRHWELCSVVQKADDTLAVHVGLSIFASLALSCLSLYLIIWDPVVSKDSIMSAITGIWMFFSLFKMIMDCVSGVLINNAVSIVGKGESCYISDVKYRQASNISRTLVGDKRVDYSDVGAAPTTSSFST